MKCLAKISALSVIIVAATMSVTIANESFKQNSSLETYLKQPLPAALNISAPKIESIVFQPDMGIDPIITGPRG